MSDKNTGDELLESILGDGLGQAYDEPYADYRKRVIDERKRRLGIDPVHGAPWHMPKPPEEEP